MDDISIIEVFISLGLLTAIYKYFENKNFDVVFVKSDIDNKDYLVRNLPDKQQAANILAQLARDLKQIVDGLDAENVENIYNNYYKVDFEKENKIVETTSDEDRRAIINKKTSLLRKIQGDINRLKSNFNENNISENTPDAKYTSYSVNKGEKIFMCIRNKNKNEELVDKNTLLFVAIHELGHLITEEIGHPPQFWKNFKFLLKYAINNNIYKYIDFNKYPKQYCGTSITDSPL